MSDRIGGNDESSINVARQIRLQRRRCNLSQRALARVSGLSRNTLSLLERGRTSPTVNTLQKLAVALDIDIAAFFEHCSHRNVVFFKASQSPTLTLSQGSLSNLGAGMANTLVTPLVLRLKHGACSGPSLSHDGLLFIYCLEGRLSYTVDEQRFELESGDSLFFDGHLQHCYEITGAEGAEALVVLSIPSDRKPFPLLENIDSVFG